MNYHVQKNKKIFQFRSQSSIKFIVLFDIVYTNKKKKTKLFEMKLNKVYNLMSNENNLHCF